MLYGALLQLIPDLDGIADLWMNDIEGLVAHRGITHSLVFAIIVTFLLGFILRKKLKEKLNLRSAFLLTGINLFMHLFLDCFNAYGTGLFEPFSKERISFHTLYVADPFFSFWLLLALIFLIAAKRTHPVRRMWAKTGLGLSCVYLVYAITNKLTVDAAVKEELQRRNISTARYFHTPTPLNSWLWFIVVKQPGGYYIAHRSVFDSKKNIPFEFVSQDSALLNRSSNKDEIRMLQRFSQDYYTVEHRGDSAVVFNVLRFGQVTGWAEPRNHFAFYYYLDNSGSNDLIVQRGRFENWNKKTLGEMFKRIRGN